jgi:hypothetical protein
MSLRQNLLKGIKIAGLLENPRAGIGAIDHVINDAPYRGAQRPPHR